MRRLLIVLGSVAGIYLVVLGGMFVLMLQPPIVFAKAVSKLPGATFMIVPFQPLWLLARRGDLKVGDEAPDFNLQTVDKNARVRIASLRGQKPVVLVFGSYT